MDKYISRAKKYKRAQFGFEASERDGVKNNPDGSHSTHLMRTETIDGINWVSFPTLFQNPDGTWLDMSDEVNWKLPMMEAKRRGELIHFGPNKKEALEYGKGSWKPKDPPYAQEGKEVNKRYYNWAPVVSKDPDEFRDEVSYAVATHYGSGDGGWYDFQQDKYDGYDGSFEVHDLGGLGKDRTTGAELLNLYTDQGYFDKKNKGEYKNIYKFYGDNPYIKVKGNRLIGYNPNTGEELGNYFLFPEYPKGPKISPKKLKTLPVSETDMTASTVDVFESADIGETIDPKFHHRKFKYEDGKYWAYNPVRDKNVNTEKKGLKGDGWYTITRNTWDRSIKDAAWNPDTNQYEAWWYQGGLEDGHIKNESVLEYLRDNSMTNLVKMQDGQEIMLPEVTVSALTDKSYNKLSDVQKQVYDSFIGPDGGVSQTVDIGNDYRMHWSDALKMVDDVGVRNIYNRPNIFMDYGSKGDVDFRAHANPVSKDIYIPKLAEEGDSHYIQGVKDLMDKIRLGEAAWVKEMSELERSDYLKRLTHARDSVNRKVYFDNLIAELAHIPEFWRSETFRNIPITIKRRIERGIKEGRIPDYSNYRDPKDIEYHTHTGPNSFEQKLREKYGYKEISNLQDGEEVVEDPGPDWIVDEYGNVQTDHLDGDFTKDDVKNYMTKNYETINTSNQQNALLRKLKSQPFRDRYAKNYFNITGENLSEEELTDKINRQYDWTAAGAPFHAVYPHISHYPETGYRAHHTPIMNPFTSVDAAYNNPQWRNVGGVYYRNKYHPLWEGDGLPAKRVADYESNMVGDLNYSINIPEFAKYSYVPFLTKKRNAYNIDNPVELYGDWRDTVIHEYAHSYNTQDSPLFGDIRFRNLSGDDQKGFVTGYNNPSYQKGYSEMPGPRYKAWLTDLFGEDYFDENTNKYGNWAMHPWEISSIKAENEAAMKRLNIWDHAKEPFSADKHLNKMLNKWWELPEDASAFQLQSMGFQDLARKKRELNILNKDQKEKLKYYNYAQQDGTITQYIEDHIINPNTDPDKYDFYNPVMNMADFNNIFNKAQTDLKDKHKYSDYASLVEDYNAPDNILNKRKKERATNILNTINEQILKEIENNVELEDTKRQFEIKREEVAPKLEKYFNEIAQNEEIGDDIGDPMSVKYGGSLPKAQDGVPENIYSTREKNLEAKNYLRKYIMSPMYLERLAIEFPEVSERDLIRERDLRLKNLNSVSVSIPDNPLSNSGNYGGVLGLYTSKEHHQSPSQLEYNRKHGNRGHHIQLEPNPYYNYQMINLHEYSHAIDADGTSNKTIDLIDSITKKSGKEKNPLSYDPGIDYLRTPTEFVARLQAIRYRAFKEGLYNPMTEKFTKEHLELLKNNHGIRNDNHFKDLYNILKGDEKEQDKNLIKSMNEIAMEPTPNMDFVKKGTEVKDPFYSRRKYSTSASKYRRGGEKRLPKFQDKGQVNYGEGTPGVDYMEYEGKPLNKILPEVDVDGRGWWKKAYQDYISPAGHTVLDVLGFIPAVGEIADGVNALWYTGEGNYVDAGLSASAMIPFAGWAATLGKWGKNTYKAMDEIVDGGGDMYRQLQVLRKSNPKEAKRLGFKNDRQIKKMLQNNPEKATNIIESSIAKENSNFSRANFLDNVKIRTKDDALSGLNYQKGHWPNLRTIDPNNITSHLDRMGSTGKTTLYRFGDSYLNKIDNVGVPKSGWFSADPFDPFRYDDMRRGIQGGKVFKIEMPNSLLPRNYRGIGVTSPSTHYGSHTLFKEFDIPDWMINKNTMTEFTLDDYTKYLNTLKKYGGRIK